MHILDNITGFKIKAKMTFQINNNIRLKHHYHIH